jgi:DNA repair protein RadC
VLELLLTFAIPRRNVKPYAKALLAQFGSLRAVFDASAEELQQVEGIGPNAAVLLRLLKETASLYLVQRLQAGTLLESPKAIVDYCGQALQGQRNERFQAIFLNAKNEVVGIETVSEGTVDWSAMGSDSSPSRTSPGRTGRSRCIATGMPCMATAKRWSWTRERGTCFRPTGGWC